MAQSLLESLHIEDLSFDPVVKIVERVLKSLTLE
jgi:hypothetical protein